MPTLSDVAAEHFPAANKLTVKGKANAGVEVRALVNATLPPGATAADIFRDFRIIPAAARGTGVGANFTITMDVPGVPVGCTVCVVTGDSKRDDPLVEVSQPVPGGR